LKTNPDSEIKSEVHYEYYHIIEGKVTRWNSFKKTRQFEPVK